jgi:hypothetical protein
MITLLISGSMLASVAFGRENMFSVFGRAVLNGFDNPARFLILYTGDYQTERPRFTGVYDSIRAPSGP